MGNVARDLVLFEKRSTILLRSKKKTLHLRRLRQTEIILLRMTIFMSSYITIRTIRKMKLLGLFLLELRNQADLTNWHNGFFQEGGAMAPKTSAGTRVPNKIAGAKREKYAPVLILWVRIRLRNTVQLISWFSIIR
jgi:hypothetical protein